MKKICSLLLALIIISAGAMAQSKKEIREGERMARYITAVQALKTKKFGLASDSFSVKPYGTPYSTDNVTRSFIGFEGDFLVMKGLLFTPSGSKHRFVVSNYEVKVDKKGNVRAEFDYKGLNNSGTVTIYMKAGNNYADVNIRRNVNSPYYNRSLSLMGDILPAETFNFEEDTEIHKL
ncbi:MAG: DUF4251 domain-containing protein [Bacteroidales bacterium]|nr:DUF4251 domain-containing protein [Bacteroidales bacterium]